MKKCILAGVLFALSNFAFGGDLPDPVATPGAINPAVTQDNIQSTICVPGWTKAIRPPASYTNKLKASRLSPDEVARDYEEDHLISLEIGGHPTDPRNLWPQHWSPPFGAHQKDQLENALKRSVCAGELPLNAAQTEIATDWIAAYKKYVKP